MMSEQEKYALEQLAIRVKDYASVRTKSVARGAETPTLAALLLQQYALGIQDAVAIIFDENRVALDCFRSFVDVDDEIAKIDPQWREHGRERWKFSPADIVNASEEETPVRYNPIDNLANVNVVVEQAIRAIPYNLENIDRLVTKEGFAFQAWDDRYSKGVWAALGMYESQVDIVRDLSEAGDLDMMPAMEYVFSAEWLPYVTGRTLAEAMQNLEYRLKSLPKEQLQRGSEWRDMVTDAIDALYEATNRKSWYSDTSKPDHLDDLPKTFAEALTKHKEGSNK